jgi:cell division control protein 7
MAGTFSSVYLAYDRRHGKYHNEFWTNKADSTKRSNFNFRGHKVKLALKRILATSSPARIENEIEILESLRSAPPTVTEEYG